MALSGLELRKVIDSWINHWTSGGDVVEIDSPDNPSFCLGRQRARGRVQ